ncbi:MAG: hypothetical protein KatS3mg119_2272 [Rhodothalassiaceae bacterium]|nr:MAG: hypothetical protein KatS3mg119_2272 [Rhodothalassiaceae bacterium]
MVTTRRRAGRSVERLARLFLPMLALLLLSGSPGWAQATGSRIDRSPNYPMSVLRFDEPSELAAARAALKRGDPEEAIRLMEELLAHDSSPDVQYAGHNALCAALTAAGRYEAAGAACDRAIAIRPRHWMAHNTLGNLHLVQGRLEAAIAEYRIALSQLRARSREAKVVRYNLALAERALARRDGS